MLFPHAALHHTISSEEGRNSVKQIGQSPSIGFRLDGLVVELELEADADPLAMGGALAKMVRSSYETG